jgi:polysaccharide chain length determinant protein (PEP-CTERM system associated)
MEQIESGIGDYLAILNRRKWGALLSMLGVFLLAAIVALALPAVYKSASTILIEQQDIPSDFVISSATGYAEQQLQIINKRIMSSSRLLELINQNNLYTDLKDTQTTDEILGIMRKSVRLETISADVTDPRTGRPAKVTMAFTLSYEGKDPRTVLTVANALTTMFLNENLKVKEKQAAETTNFLESEMEKVKADLAVADSRVARYKEKNISSLPDMLQVNMQSLHSIQIRIQQLSQQLRSLKERAGYLEVQLANTPPTLKFQRQNIMTTNEKRLEELNTRLTHLQTQFSDAYPDVVETRAEIATIEERLRKAGKDTGGKVEIPQNPAYITLASQLESTRSEIASVMQQMEEFKTREAQYQVRIEATPRVEEAFKAMLIERNNLQAKVEDLMRKTMEARVAQGLEKEQKGERFTLIDAPRMPEKPFKPNRLAIVLIGLVLGMGTGVGVASVREFMDDSVRSPLWLSRRTMFPVLAEIPEIVTAKDRYEWRKKRCWVVAGVIVAIAIGIFSFHKQVMDLNIFWAKVMNRFFS